MEESDFLALLQVDGIAFSIVEVDPPKILHIVFIDQVLGELVLLNGDGRVVVEKQVEYRDVVGVPVVSQ